MSNDVFEKEIEAVNIKIAAYKAKKLAIPDELTDRQQQLQLGMTMLAMSVENGQLTEEVYLGRMKQKIEEEKKRARAFISQGKKDWAAQCLQRIKIMQAEIVATVEE